MDPYTPYLDMPDVELVGAQLFDMMQSLKRDNTIDHPIGTF